MLVRWNAWPWNDAFEHELTRFFGRNRGQTPAAPEASWHPAVDITEDEKAYQLVADLPGVSEKDVNISVDKNVMTLRGERKLERKDEGEGYCRHERAQGLFSRSFTLPSTVDADNVTAQLRNGVLTLTLPKKAEAQPRQIKVEAN